MREEMIFAVLKCVQERCIFLKKKRMWGIEMRG